MRCVASMNYNTCSVELGLSLFAMDSMCFGLLELPRRVCKVQSRQPLLLTKGVSLHTLLLPTPPRWIVWKLAAMERRFPEHFSEGYLTADRVSRQLQYRWVTHSILRLVYFRKGLMAMYMLKYRV